jgi:hypothetical protein
MRLRKRFLVSIGCRSRCSPYATRVAISTWLLIWRLCNEFDGLALRSDVLISTIETALEIPSIPARPAVTLVTPGVLLNWHSNLRVILAMSYVIAEPYIGGHGRRVCRYLVRT